MLGEALLSDKGAAGAFHARLDDNDMNSAIKGHIMRCQIRYILLAILLCVCGASPALAASVTLTSSSADAPFIVQGNDMNGVAGMKLTVVYDPAVLASPTVTWGSLISGALPLANTTAAGIITIAIIKSEPLTGSGPIAAISFAVRKSGGGIPVVSVDQMIDSNGTNLLAQAGTATADPGFTKTAGIPFSQPETVVSSTATSTTGTSATSTSTSSTVVPGTISMPDDKQEPKSEAPPAEPMASPPAEHVEPAETTAREPTQSPAEAPVETAVEASKPVVVKQTVYGSVLERFRVYQGTRSPEELVALFKKPVSATIRQEPVVAISDGKRSVRVTVDVPAINGASSNFALSEASLVSLKKDEVAGAWTLDVLPRLNSLKASVTIVGSSAIIEFPLTVVPPIAAISGKPADFAAFLADSGVENPKHDLNGDGRHDYLDDFIYTAHYLNTPSSAEKKSKQ